MYLVVFMNFNLNDKALSRVIVLLFVRSKGFIKCLFYSNRFGNRDITLK